VYGCTIRLIAGIALDECLALGSIPTATTRKILRKAPRTVSKTVVSLIAAIVRSDYLPPLSFMEGTEVGSSNCLENSSAVKSAIVRCDYSPPFVSLCCVGSVATAPVL
jgi:hypothetical protein